MIFGKVRCLWFGLFSAVHGSVVLVGGWTVLVRLRVYGLGCLLRHMVQGWTVF